VKRLAAIEQNIADMLSANRIQDAHNVNTYLARMRVAEMELAAGRSEHARILATSALTGMIGLHHNVCGGAQTVNVPAANIPADLRQFFDEGEPYVVAETVEGSDPELLTIRFTHPTTC
jgi:hypothetical protein